MLSTPPPPLLHVGSTRALSMNISMLCSSNRSLCMQSTSLPKLGTLGKHQSNIKILTCKKSKDSNHAEACIK